jgi:hypothetical protein
VLGRRRMRIVPACAALLALLAVPAAARAQNDEPPPPADQRPPAAETSDLLVPTPPEWTLKYDEARARLMIGEFGDASARFEELERTAVNRVDRALAREQKTLAAEWAKRNLAFVNRNTLGESTASAKALDKRTTDELVSLYTNAVFYGLGSGIWLASVTEPKTPAAGILPAIALTGASVGTVIALDSGRGFRYGVPQSIVSGLYIGLESGIAWTVWHNNRQGEKDLEGKEQATVIWGLSTLGAVGGGVLGQTLGTTPGRSSWVGSTALWSGLIFAFTTGALVKEDDPPPAVFAAAGVGLGLGTVTGLLTASSVSPSIARVRFLDLGGLAGGLLSTALYVAIANDKTNGRAASGITALGGFGGLAAAWALTASMPDDRLRTEEPPETVAKIRPMLMPTNGGGMMGVGGVLP